MINVNVEKFLADYNAKLDEKATKMVGKDDAIKAEVEKVEKIVAENGYNDTIKEMLTAEVVKEKEKEFDFAEIDKEIGEFEKYIIVTEDVEEKEDEPVVEDVAENVENAENGEVVENVEPQKEVIRDVFGNIISQ